MHKVSYAQAYSYKYRARPGTPAAERPDQIADDVKAERFARLQAELTIHARSFNGDCVGRVMDVLFDRPGRYHGQVAGRSPYLQAVHVTPEVEDGQAELQGRILPVLITEGHANSLSGTLAASHAPSSAYPSCA